MAVTKKGSHLCFWAGLFNKGIEVSGSYEKEGMLI